jgi:hypothetical protein
MQQQQQLPVAQKEEHFFVLLISWHFSIANFTVSGGFNGSHCW